MFSVLAAWQTPEEESDKRGLSTDFTRRDRSVVRVQSLIASGGSFSAIILFSHESKRTARDSHEGTGDFFSLGTAHEGKHRS